MKTYKHLDNKEFETALCYFSRFLCLILLIYLLNPDVLSARLVSCVINPMSSHNEKVESILCIFGINSIKICMFFI